MIWSLPIPYSNTSPAVEPHGVQEMVEQKTRLIISSCPAIGNQWLRIADCTLEHDTGSEHRSDYLLVKLDLKLQLAARPKRKPPQKFDTNRFDDPNVRETFRLEMSNCFEALKLQATDEQTQSLDEEWLTIPNTIHEAAEATTGYRERLSKKWKSSRTIQHKQQISDQKSELFKRVRRQCHQSTKNDKNKY